MMKNPETTHNSKEITYQWERYELAKLMIETNNELKGISTSLWWTEKLAQIIYDPDMDHDESFFMWVMTQVIEWESIKKIITTKASNLIKDKISDSLKQLPLNEQHKALITTAQEELWSYTKEQVTEKTKELQSTIQPELDDLKDETDKTTNPTTVGTAADSPSLSHIDLTTPLATAHITWGMTYCSRTTREVASSFGLKVPRGSSAKESFDLPIIAKDQLIAEKEFDHTKHNFCSLSRDKLHSIWSKYGDTNIVMDIKLHSTTTNGQKHGHRAIGVMIDGKGYLVDPYFSYNGRKRNTLIPLHEVDQQALSLAEINYYHIPQHNMMAALDNDPTTQAA